MLGPDANSQLESMALQRIFAFTSPAVRNGEHVSQISTDDDDMNELYEGEQPTDLNITSDQTRQNALMINKVFLILVVVFVFSAVAIGLVVLLMGTSNGSSTLQEKPKALYSDIAMEYPYEYWMQVHANTLARRSLLNVTLPGMHNAGNNLLLTRYKMYGPDSEWNQFKSYISSTRGEAVAKTLNEADFHDANILWSVNQHEGLGEQLRGGARYFHLKLCNLDDSDDNKVRRATRKTPRSGPDLDADEDGTEEEEVKSNDKENSWYGSLNTSEVYHCHRGYTGMNLVDMLDVFHEFLAMHKKEVVVLSINNLYGFSRKQEKDLANLISERFFEILIRNWEHLTTTNVNGLYRTDDRLAVFFGPHLEKYPHGIIPSSHLLENWDDGVGTGGDLGVYKNWMVADIAAHASKHQQYYTLQANPNNNANSTFEAIFGRITEATEFRSSPIVDQGYSNHSEYTYINPNTGKEYTSLYEWEYDFLRGLGEFVLGELSKNPHATINAISTDFMHPSRVTELCLYINNIHT
eukprot:CFRG2058T1